MDIDDILAEIDSDGEPPETRDLRELTRLWVTERSAPEVLPWPTELMDRIGERIRRQASMLFDWRLRETADRSPQTQIEIVEEQTGNSDPKANFRLIIIQTELERFKFLVRSYLRARIAKAMAHIPHSPSYPCLATANFFPISRLTSTPSTISTTPTRGPSSRLRRSSTRRRTRRCYRDITMPRSFRSFRRSCRGWTIPLEGYR